MALLRSFVSPAPKDDAALLSRVRSGDERAYGDLWLRHSAAGLRVARTFRSSGDADDLVSESFTAIYSAIRNGNGPAGAFRPYLYATIRNLAVRSADDSNFVLHEVDFDSLPSRSGVGELPDDAAFVFDAFRSLPERWQSVIWYVEVEQMRLAEVGNLLGIKANAVSALIFRAKSALRVAWLQSQIESGNLVGEHRAVVILLGSYAQNALRSREAQRVTTHLLGCPECSDIADEVDSLARRIAVIVLPLVLGGSAAAAFLRGTHAPGSPAAGTQVAGSHAAGTQAVSTQAAAGAVSGFATVVMVSTALVVAATLPFVILVVAKPSSSGRLSPSIIAPGDSVTPHSSSATSHNSATTNSSAAADPSSSAPASHPSPGLNVPVRGVSPVRNNQSLGATDGSEALLPAGSRPTIDGGGTARLSASAVIVLTGRATAGAVVSVSENGVTLSTVVTSASGSWVARIAPVADGQYTFTAVEDRRGFSTSAAADCVVSVDTRAPSSPTFSTTALPADLSSPVFYGQAEAGALVVVSDDFGTGLTTVRADSFGRWMSGVIAGLSPALTVFSATQIDEAGNVSAAATLTLSPFVPTFASPTAGQVSLDRVVAVRILGWPGQSVRLSRPGSTGVTFQLSRLGSLDLQFYAQTPSSSVETFTLSVSYLDSSAASEVSFTVQP